MPLLQIVTPSQVLLRGLQLVGFARDRQVSVRRAKNLERFCTHFGSKPAVHASTWTDLQVTETPEAVLNLEEENTCLEHLLMAGHFLKCYPKANEAEGVFKISDTTYRKWVWFYVAKLEALKTEKIVWPAHWNANQSADEEETIFIFSVDGVHCRIQEPEHAEHSKNPAYYSHKFHQADKCGDHDSTTD